MSGMIIAKIILIQCGVSYIKVMCRFIAKGLNYHASYKIDVYWIIIKWIIYVGFCKNNQKLMNVYVYHAIYL